MSASIENKIRKLPVDMQRETEDFVDFLLEKASHGTYAAASASDECDNPLPASLTA